MCSIISLKKGGGISNAIWICFSSKKKPFTRLWKVLQVHIIGEIASASGFNHSSLFCKYKKLREMEH